MAYDNLGVLNSFNATAAIADTANFSFVTLDTLGGVVIASQGADAIGVIQEGALAGDPVPVCRPGAMTKVLAGATLTPSQFVASDATGRAVPATSGAHFLGQVIQGANVNQLAVILFQPNAARS